MNFKHLFFKAIPYVLSVAGGVLVFNISQRYMHTPGWIDLMDNVAASLLAIPLVFLFYDYSNYLVMKKMKKSQRANIITNIDGILFKILDQLKRIIKMKHIEVPMQDLNLNYRKMDFDSKYIKSIHYQLKIMEELLYKSDKIEILEPQHTQILSFIAQELNQIINECKYHNSPKEIARYVETTLSIIDDWFAATGYTTRKKPEKAKYK